MIHRFFKRFTRLLLLAAPGMSFAQNLPAPEEETGTQIAWASEAFAVNLMADGITTFEDSGKDINFELGTFAPGFDPTTATPEEWISSWIVLQGAEYDMIDQQFIQTATLSSNTAPFLAGTRAYIWGYTTKDLGNGAEWLVVGAPAWTWPDADSPLPTTFSMSDAEHQDAFFGSVNQYGYHMQLAAVPEPSALWLASLAGLAFALHRRRGA